MNHCSRLLLLLGLMPVLACFQVFAAPNAQDTRKELTSPAIVSPSPTGASTSSKGAESLGATAPPQPDVKPSQPMQVTESPQAIAPNASPIHAVDIGAAGLWTWVTLGLDTIAIIFVLGGYCLLSIKLDQVTKAGGDRERRLQKSIGETGKSVTALIAELTKRITSLEKRLSREDAPEPASIQGAPTDSGAKDLLVVPAAQLRAVGEQPMAPQYPAENFASSAVRQQRNWDSIATALAAAMNKLYDERVAIDPDNAQSKLFNAMPIEIANKLQSLQLTVGFYSANGQLPVQGGELIFAYLGRTPNDPGWVFPDPRHLRAASMLEWFKAGASHSPFWPAKGRLSENHSLERLERGQL